MLWLTLTTLLAAAGGDPEPMLRRLFARHSRAGAFHDLNFILALFWAAHSYLFLMALAAVWCRRLDVCTVLLIGPVFGVAINLLGESWSDPNWYVILAVCTIGWVVGTFVAGSYWLAKPAGRTASPAAPAEIIVSVAAGFAELGREAGCLVVWCSESMLATFAHPNDWCR